MSAPYEQLNHWIDQLQADAHPDVVPDATPEDVALLLTAAMLAGARPGADEPDPAFLARLRLQLQHSDPATQRHPGPAPSTAPDRVPAAAPRRWDWSAILDRVLGTPLNRRGLLTNLGTLAAGLVAGLGLESWRTQSEVETVRNEAHQAQAEVGVLREAAGIAPVKQGVLPASQGKWFAVARATDVAIGEAIPVIMGTCKGFLLRTDAQQFSALSAVCTHFGCELKWAPERRSFECPCHGGIYDITGQPIAGPALYTTPVRRLPRFSWKIEEDIVYVLA